MDVLDHSRGIEYFQMDANVQMGGSPCGVDGISEQCGTEGMSFVFGALPDTAFDEQGVGPGLRPPTYIHSSRRATAAERALRSAPVVAIGRLQCIN